MRAVDTKQGPSDTGLRLAVSALAGLMALAGAFIPPFNGVAWLAMGVPIGLVEQWWYGLSGVPIPVLHGVGVALAASLYPLTVAGLCFLLFPRRDRPDSLYGLRRLALLFVVVVSSQIWHATNEEYAMLYQGREWYAVVMLVNSVIAGGLCTLWFWGRRRASWSVSLATHLLLFLWMTTLAFPLMGEFF